MASDVLTDAHEKSARLDLHELVRVLNSHLGATLVATLSGVKDRKAPYKWAKAGGIEPRPEAQRRLLAAHRVWSMISTTENHSVARSWFIGANPRLGEESPVMELRNGNIAGVMSAAQAFIEGADD